MTLKIIMTVAVYYYRRDAIDAVASSSFKLCYIYDLNLTTETHIYIFVYGSLFIRFLICVARKSL